MNRLLLGVVHLAVLTVFGCATKTTPIDVAEPYFSIQELKSVPTQAPLPNKYEIFITWHYPNNTNITQLGFEAWDVDRDGRFDMVYSLGGDRQKIAVTYDFNGDSVPDLTERLQKSQSAQSIESKKIVSEEAFKMLLQLSH